MIDRSAFLKPPTRSATRVRMHESLFRESFYYLATQLGYQGNDPYRSLIVTSANPLEGKSTVAVNLALTIARGKRRVLLVDADMSRPVLHKVFGRNISPGLVDLIQQGSESGLIEKTISEVAPGLFLLPHGLKSSTDPGMLLQSPDFARLVKALSEQHTSIIWDTRPVLSASEVLPLASLAENALLVLGSGRVTQEESIKAKTLLERAGCHVVGAVLNNICR